RYYTTGRFASRASCIPSGPSANAADQTNPIVKMVRMTAVHLMIWAAFIPARSLYLSFSETVSWLVAAAKLKEKTRTGMTSQTEDTKSPNAGISPNESSCQYGMSQMIKKAKAAIMGYTIQPVTIDTSFGPVIITADIPNTNISDNIQRGQGSIPSWLTIKESTVFVIDTA